MWLTRSSLCRSFWLVAVILLFIGNTAASQSLEGQLQGVTNVGADEFVGAGGGLNLRTAGRTRLGFTASLGVLEGKASFRTEALVTYGVSPSQRRGPSPYLGGGVALSFTNSLSRQYLVVLVGVDWNSGTRVGWFLEGGVGGGLRFAAGARFRRTAVRVR